MLRKIAWIRARYSLRLSPASRMPLANALGALIFGGGGRVKISDLSPYRSVGYTVCTGQGDVEPLSVGWSLGWRGVSSETGPK
jgi:hypothetical protein